jgi:hypothetical protein
MWSFRLFRNSEHDQNQIEQARGVNKQSRELLMQNPALDIFIGRKTQEPFPVPPEAASVEGWLNSKELQPPEET